METIDALLHGFSVAATPYNLLWAVVGVTVGTAIGALPGLGPSTTVALLMPLTYNVDPTAAFIMFAGIYYGSQYGGSTASILLNTPGEPGAMMTAVEGNQMARRGRGAQALATAAIGSFIAGTLGTIALTFVAPLMVKIALMLGAPEYFALMVLALAAVTAVISGSIAKGIASLAIGLLLGAVGLDPTSGQPRFTFGIMELLDGIDVTIVAVGLFAVGETLFVVSRRSSIKAEVIAVAGSLWMSREDWSRSWRPWLRGTLFGFPIGALPAGGAEVPTMLSYATEKRLSKHPEEFGHGAIEGVAGPEAANNASAAGALAPLLALGLPTSATAAVLLAAFQQYGLRPGPLLFETNPDLVWGLIASLYIGNVLLLLLNLPLVGVWVSLLKVPKPWLYAGILCFATLGAYTLNNNVVDIGMLWLIGLMGFGMRMLNVPIVPCVLGFILGPMLELMLRRALAINQGDPSVFFTRPISLFLLLLTFSLLLGPPAYRMWRRRREAAQAPGSAA